MAEPTSDPPRGRPPLRKNPYFWAAIAGLVLVPAIRPLTRRVPEPPPAVGRMPAFELTDRAGHAVSSQALADHVYLATLLVPSARDRQLDALVKSFERCRRMGVKLWLVTFAGDEDVAPLALRIEARVGRLTHEPPGWIVLAGRPARGIAAGALDAGRSLLVDGEGGLRGAYPTDDDGLYEVFHRAQHVMSLRKVWR